ncbi:hypothetical protein AAFF_G00104950 [Aldrovandia affinis]|uniref:Uncharacterized protein n=1 Tax=Aldrovandia affinis TaxID=143900 RepID=A0AAD7T228_9TELE|nr:hypothetical protein AAFF_G00104950 [Aldrovandia affinis]
MMMLAFRIKVFRYALYSEKRQGCLSNAQLLRIAAYTLQTRSATHTDQRQGRHYWTVNNVNKERFVMCEVSLLR